MHHAEEDSVSNPADQTLLVRRYPAALFTIDTKRTRATLALLASLVSLSEATKLKLQV